MDGVDITGLETRLILLVANKGYINGVDSHF